MSATIWIIIAGAVLTYLTRIGGDLVISRFERLHPRVEAALNAVPAAVLTTLVAPAVVTNGLPELIALAVTAAVGWRFSLMPCFFAGAATIIVLRAITG